MRIFVPDRTCWSLLLTALAIILRYKPTYDKLRVLIINKDVRKLLACKNGNENPIWSWNDSWVLKHGRYYTDKIILKRFNSFADNITYQHEVKLYILVTYINLQ